MKLKLKRFFAYRREEGESADEAFAKERGVPLGRGAAGQSVTGAFFGSAGLPQPVEPKPPDAPRRAKGRAVEEVRDALELAETYRLAGGGGRSGPDDGLGAEPGEEAADMSPDPLPRIDVTRQVFKGSYRGKSVFYR